jgi:alkanesulfonate monooxygenase SsuD/methylene tetrahydromethanopterin reductase-like flavin-dependent oxidoreductase (luciferase family)
MFSASRNSTEFCAHCEELGVDGLTWGESPTQFPDPYTQMARAALVTDRVLLGTVVTAPGLRHPATLANQFMALQQLSSGRAYCGIGTGDLSLIEMGEKPFPMDQFVEYASTVRGLMAGEEVTWNGHRLRMRLEETATAPVPVPVWFGADGPRGLQAAGEFADGIVVGQVGSPDVVRWVIERAGAAAAAAGRSLEDLQIWFLLRTVLTDKENGAIDIDGLDEYGTRGMRYLWRTAGRPARGEVAAAVLERKGLVLDEDIADRLWQFNDQFVAADAWDSKTNVALMDRLGLREFAGRHFYISGSAEDVTAGIRKLIDAGARNFITPFMARERRPGDEDEMAAVLNALR